jgi:hypothetical protein
MAITRTIELKTAIPGPRSREILERKERVVANPLSVFLPVVISEGRGATITDVDGNTFIDFTGGVGCLNVGHSHPRVVEAAQQQLTSVAVPFTREGGVLQRRHGGGRERNQVRPRLHRPSSRDRLRGRLPRPHPAVALPDLEDASV